VGDNGVRALLAPVDPAVGIMENEYTIEYAQIEPGETLVLYTDGITEARNPQRQMFGEQTLFSLLQQPFSSAPALLTRISEMLQAYRDSAIQSDDITLLALHRERFVPD
jgi:phosphoserine phosphatase RsbU/P